MRGALLDYVKGVAGTGAALTLAGPAATVSDLTAAFGISIPAWLVWAVIAGAFIAALILGPEIVALIAELFSEGMTVQEIIAY